MTIELVVARYLEELAWLNNIPPQITPRVYDKSPTGNLPNIGREAHTYLHHICENYDVLPDLTVFAQGKPFDHAFDFHKTLRALTAATADESEFRWLGHIIDTDDENGARLFAMRSKKNKGNCAIPPLHSYLLRQLNCKEFSSGKASSELRRKLLWTMI